MDVKLMPFELTMKKTNMLPEDGQELRPKHVEQ